MKHVTVRLSLALIAAGYLVLFAIFVSAERRGRPATRIQIVLATCTAFVPVLLAVLIFDPAFSKTAAVVSPILAIALLTTILTIPGRDRSRLALVTVLALVGIGLQVSYATGMLGRPKRLPLLREYQIGTSLYELEVVSFRQWLPRQKAHQGGITKVGDRRFLVATGDGDLYVFSRAPQARATRRRRTDAPLR